MHSQRCPFVHQKSLKHRKATFCSEKIFPEILRGQCLAFKILLTLILTKERFNRYTDRQTDLFSKFQIGDPFLSLRASEL